MFNLGIFYVDLLVIGRKEQILDYGLLVYTLYNLHLAVRVFFLYSLKVKFVEGCNLYFFTTPHYYYSIYNFFKFKQKIVNVKEHLKI
ncbi:hypothetical protein NQ318_006326 [Aromia moschata]|uniref:Uncharacterized protein n=1 Tax=Aromia moschata TaxID=1265417 RepID=A0AAV8XXC1_9CUCU|nr:hypothetical protein NQ318_006326 [Aromia moschata]